MLETSKKKKLKSLEITFRVISFHFPSQNSFLKNQTKPQRKEKNKKKKTEKILPKEKEKEKKRKIKP